MKLFHNQKRLHENQLYQIRVQFFFYFDKNCKHHESRRWVTEINIIYLVCLLLKS